MMKTFLFAVALASLAVAGGCATGGNGVVPPPVTIDVTITSPSDTSPLALYPTEPVTITAKVSNATTTAVTWSLSGTSCTGSACGTLTPTNPAPTPATAAYKAPSTPISGVTVTATLAADSTKTGTLSMTVVDVTSDVAPATLSVGQGLTQTFTAVAVPDVAGTQNFTWTCTAGGAPCGANDLVQDPNVSGLAYYTANDSCNTKGCVQISAAAKLASPTACAGASAGNCTIAKATPVASRVSGTYAFRFSGYDSSNDAVAVAGTFTVAANGSISGVEDELTRSGASTGISITGGSYTPNTSDLNNSNNAGTLTLTLPSGVYPNRYQVVLDGAGDIEMIESDGKGTGSGTAQISSDPSKVFPKSPSPIFAFGFTGVDSALSRVGYAGLITMNPDLSVSSGLIDVNDNGNSTNSICGSGAPPCAVTGSYKSNSNGSWLLTLSTSSATMKFHFYVASGGAGKTDPLTLYAISTDGGAIPAVSGTMVLEDSSLTYDNAHFKGTSVTALTGTALTATATCPAPPCANVSLTLGTTDGNGKFSGVFDQNSAGTILSVPQITNGVCVPASCNFSYTYAASGTSGRYIFNLLGDPTATTPVAPLPFVLYATGGNRGFLLDTSSRSVITGTMSPQGKTAFGFPGSALPSTFAAATTSSGSSAVNAIAANLLLTWVNTGTCTATCVNGTQYDAANPAGVPVTGANPGYTMQTLGNGTIALAAPSAQNYVIYAVDTSGCTNSSPVCAVLDFLMMDVDKTNPNASIIFAQQ
jgi:hypothetical protein